MGPEGTSRLSPLQGKCAQDIDRGLDLVLAGTFLSGGGFAISIWGPAVGDQFVPVCRWLAILLPVALPSSTHVRAALCSDWRLIGITSANA